MEILDRFRHPGFSAFQGHPIEPDDITGREKLAVCILHPPAAAELIDDQPGAGVVFHPAKGATTGRDFVSGSADGHGSCRACTTPGMLCSKAIPWCQQEADHQSPGSASGYSSGMTPSLVFSVISSHCSRYHHQPGAYPKSKRLSILSIIVASQTLNTILGMAESAAVLALASRTFAAYYGLQAVTATITVWHRPRSTRRAWKLALFPVLIVALILKCRTGGLSVIDIARCLRENVGDHVRTQFF